jgi:protein-disulfide isomerase
VVRNAANAWFGRDGQFSVSSVRRSASLKSASRRTTCRYSGRRAGTHACGMFHPILEQMHNEFGDRLRITFREYPLPGHNHAVAAASASEAAGLQKKFWEMHDLIYENQKDWKDRYDVVPIFEGYAKQIGLDVERWKRDMSSEQVAQRIFLDSRRGQSMGVKGTPTAFLNGREVPFETLMQPDKLRALIQNEISTTGSR